MRATNEELQDYYQRQRLRGTWRGDPLLTDKGSAQVLIAALTHSSASMCCILILF
jgi:hypothetical protein